MNSLNDFYIDEATIEDSDQILNLLETTISKGNIETYYTRRPNAFTSYSYEGNDVKIITVRNKEKEIVVKMILAMRDVYINQNIETICYCTGIRVKGSYQKVNWPKMLSKYTKDNYPNIKLYYLTVLKDNYDSFKVFDKPRPYLPKVNRIGDFCLYFIKTGFKKRKTPFILKKATTNDEERIISFLNKKGREYNFSPVVSRLEHYHNLKIEDFHYIEINGEIVFTCAVWNQQSYKQYVIKNYKGIYKLLSKFPNISSIFGYMKLPKKGMTANYATVSFLMCNKEYYSYLPSIIRMLSNSYKKEYDFLIFSRELSDHITKYFECFKHIPYNSIIHVGYFEETPLLNQVLNHNKQIYLECGTL